MQKTFGWAPEVVQPSPKVAQRGPESIHFCLPSRLSDQPSCQCGGANPRGRASGLSVPTFAWYSVAMSSGWPMVSYEQWSATCDTLHAHTQVLGKLAAVLAPPEPQLQHAALRLSARGWETAPLPAPDSLGALVVALDLRTHEAVVEHSDGRVQRVALVPDQP